MSEEKYTPEQLEQMADQLLAGDNAPAGADKPCLLYTSPSPRD